MTDSEPYANRRRKRVRKRSQPSRVRFLKAPGTGLVVGIVLSRRLAPSVRIVSHANRIRSNGYAAGSELNFVHVKFRWTSVYCYRAGSHEESRWACPDSSILFDVYRGVARAEVRAGGNAQPAVCPAHCASHSSGARAATGWHAERPHLAAGSAHQFIYPTRTLRRTACD